MPPDIDTAIGLHRAGRLTDAEVAYRQILAADPDNFDALHLSGLIALQQGNPGGAIDLLTRAVAVEPSAAAAAYHLGSALRACGRLDEARASLESAIELNPSYPEALNELGLVHRGRNNYSLARTCFERAVALKDAMPEAHCNLGGVLREFNEADHAIACFRKALSLAPELVEAHFLLAKTCHQKGMIAEALAGYQEALQYKPDIAEAHFNIGHILHDQAFDEDALKCFQSALECQPDFVEAKWAIAMSQLTLVYGEGEDPERFRDAFSRGLDDLDAWFDDNRRHLGYMAVGSQQPFYIAYQEFDNRNLLSKYGDLCVKLMRDWQDSERIEVTDRRANRRKIAVGIVNAHIRDHSVWSAITKGWVDRLDRSKFSISLFHLGYAEDAETAHAKARVDEFVQGLFSVQAWAKALVERQLDVLIYPEIGMDPMTLKLAALRLAPVQVAAWGHPETTGLSTIDYFLSAADFEPENAASHYRERLIALPNLGCYYEQPEVAPLPVDLESLGIDSRMPILICPGVPYKYTPQHDDALVRIAESLQQCQLVFFDHSRGNLSQKLAARLESSFAKAGLHFDNYGVFVPWLKRPAFYELLRRADVFLDTMGFSGFNTAMQAVECGLPIVAYEGRFMRGRLASAIMNRMGLHDLVAVSQETYVRIAVELVQNQQLRADARGRIDASRHLLFNDTTPIHALEKFISDVTKDTSQRSNAPLAR